VKNQSQLTTLPANAQSKFVAECQHFTAVAFLALATGRPSDLDGRAGNSDDLELKFWTLKLAAAFQGLEQGGRE
jgi:hypothetical protein